MHRKTARPIAPRREALPLPASSKLDFLFRARYQILAGILIAIMLPVAVRQAISGMGIQQPTQYNTAIGGTIAMVLGYMSYRRLHVFPGIASGGYIITAFSATFALLAMALFLFRLDYSRVQFLSSYLLTLSLFTFTHLRFFARRPVLFGVIPAGNVDALPYVDRVYWHHIPAPESAVPRLEGVVVDLQADHSDAWNSRIAAFALNGVPVYHVKEAMEQLLGRVEIDHLSENTLGSLNPNDLYLKVKGFLDAVAALILLIVLLPVLLVVALMIRLDSPGPSLFTQQRTGFRARPFTVYKFRTMRTAPANSDPEQARVNAMTQSNDPRITRLGSFLRKSRLDELPQLINILKGEMSLIGPRPEAVALTSWYEREIPFYHYRHIIKPGVTGWAQINQGHVADVDDVREKLNLDFYYVKNFSMWLDILIALRTIRTMFTGHGAR